MSLSSEAAERSLVDSTYAWLRLGVALALSAIGSAGMWSVVVVLPAVQAEFGVSRADASLPYTLTLIGFALGGVLLGRLADRLGVIAPLLCGALALGVGYVGTGFAPTLAVFALLHGLIGFGSSASFGPLIADITHWFDKRRGIAVAICASGNYLAGTVWPPLVQYVIETQGWRSAQIALGIFCLVSMAPTTVMLRAKGGRTLHAARSRAARLIDSGVSPNTVLALLALAGFACCMAMAMPQVHIVAYCGDLGYGVARGAEMLSLMLGFGIISRLASGMIADRIGGVPTLLLGSALQAVGLALYLMFDGLTSLYVISALFGLFQGGIVPSYAIIVREYFAPNEAGTRLGIVLMATLVGMAAGGWVSGFIFDLTASYAMAFLNGLLWNMLNVSIALWLLLRPGRRLARA